MKNHTVINTSETTEPMQAFLKNVQRGILNIYMPFILQVIRKEKNIPVVSPVTLMLCLWAASMTAGTRSSAGSPWSSATPGGYQDKTRTPGAPHSREEVHKGNGSDTLRYLLATLFGKPL